MLANEKINFLPQRRIQLNTESEKLNVSAFDEMEMFLAT